MASESLSSIESVHVAGRTNFRGSQHQQCIASDCREFSKLPGDGKLRELVRGEVVELGPTAHDSAPFSFDWGGRLQAWCESRNAGWIGVESGFVLAHDPNTVRGPDVALLSDRGDNDVRIDEQQNSSYHRIYPRSATKILTAEPVGTISTSFSPAPANNTRYSSAVRSSPS